MKYYPEFGKNPEKEMLSSMREKSKIKFDEWKKICGAMAVLKYIEDATGNAQNVILNWLEGRPHPSSGICKGIFNCLNNLQKGDLPSKEASLPVRPAVSQEIISPAPKNKSKKRKQTPAEKMEHNARVFAKELEKTREILKRLKEKGIIE